MAQKIRLRIWPRDCAREGNARQVIDAYETKEGQLIAVARIKY